MKCFKENNNGWRTYINNSNSTNPATPTRDSTTTQALATAQAQRYAGPSTFTNSILTGYSGAGLGNTTGAGSSLLGG